MPHSGNWPGPARGQPAERLPVLLLCEGYLLVMLLAILAYALWPSAIQ